MCLNTNGDPENLKKGDAHNPKMFSILAELA